jgi:hypothetical protein
MRGNGLSAQAYVAVADLDRRTADVLLDELRLRGVAAYAAESPEPGAGSAGGADGPVDRLYVDADAEQQARSMIDEQLGHHGGTSGGDEAPQDRPEPGRELDYDAAFADIVAGFHTAGTTGVGRWSADEDLDPERSEPSEPSQPPGSAGSLPAGGASYVGWDEVLRPEAGGAGAAAGPQVPEGPDPQDRYVPPPPPPLPRGSRRTIAAWAAVVGGPAVLFAAAIFGFQLDNLVLLVAVVAFLAGFVTLVAGLRDDDDEGDGDDGAVV